ncbi:Ctr copper transporter [Xylariaceae sp. FL1019]|nr:Ctr copper transporter [Xylariaceae sp. FL1019]
MLPRHTMDDMDGMDMDTTGSNTMVFTSNIQTPLYSTTWTPTTAAGYAGTIIFLILLAILLRVILAAKALAEARWLEAELSRRYVVVQGKVPISEQVSGEDLSRKMTLTENGVEEDVVVLPLKHQPPRPWRLSVDPVRAGIDTVIAGVGYLLMLAVMTLNVGYFIAVLFGTFAGSLIVGRYNIGGQH